MEEVADEELHNLYLSGNIIKQIITMLMFL
jgi:hypothetical protein